MLEGDPPRRGFYITASLVSITMSKQEVPSSVAQRVIIKFLTTEGVKPSEILRRLKTQFGDNTLKKTQVYAWHKQFLEGREAVENEGHRRRPRISVTEENIHIVGRLLEDDRRLTVLRLERIANFWTKQNSHIVGKDANFQSETLSCFTTMPGLIQLSKLVKKLRVCSGLHWNILSTVRTYRRAIIICLDR